MENKSFYYKLIFFFSQIAAFMIALFLLYTLLYRKYDTDSESLTYAKSVVLNDKEYTNVEVEKIYKTIDEYGKGDVITVNFEIPNDADYKNFSLMLDIRYSAIQVYRGENLIYDWSFDKFKKGEYIGKSMQFIPLGDVGESKELSIVYYINSNATYSWIYPPLIGDYDALVHNYILSNAIPFAMALFITVFNLCYIIVTLVYSWTITDLPRHIITFVFALEYNIWLLARYNIFVILSRGVDFTYVEFISSYIFLPIIMLMIAYICKDKYADMEKNIAVFSGVVAMAFLFLPITGLVQIQEYKLVNGTLFLMATVYLLFKIVYIVKNDKQITSRFIMILGIFLLCVGIIFDQFADFASHVFSFTVPFFLRKMAGNGAYFFATAQIMDYFIFVAGEYMYKIESKSLESVAYEDAMTGLKNRAYHDKTMAELEKNKGQEDFGIILFDCDALKKVNDELGHAMGDALIKEFGECIKETFTEDNHSASRVGGDEFAVVVRGTNWDDMEALLDKFQDIKTQHNEVNPFFVGKSITMGYALASENDYDPYKTYVDADSGMYKVKAIYYEKNGNPRGRGR